MRRRVPGHQQGVSIAASLKRHAWLTRNDVAGLEGGDLAVGSSTCLIVGPDSEHVFAASCQTVKGTGRGRVWSLLRIKHSRSIESQPQRESLTRRANEAMQEKG